MSKAVADVYGIKLSGTLAWLLWRGFYLSFLPGFAAKLRVGVNWLLNSVMPPNIVQIQSTPPATRYIHYRKGDRVFEPGMLIDGFYTVTKGSFKLTIDNPETGEHFEKVFGPGEHFGERVLLKSALRTGLVVALEDGVLLFIAQKDFTRFARAFPFLDNYFKDYIERTFGGDREVLRAGQRQPQARTRDVALELGVREFRVTGNAVKRTAMLAGGSPTHFERAPFGVACRGLISRHQLP